MFFRHLKGEEISLPKTIKKGEKYYFVDSPGFRRLVESKIKEINKNSDLPYKMLFPHYRFEKFHSGKFEYIENYMSFDYNSPKVKLVFCGYPNDECLYYLTEMTVDLGAYSVMSINKWTTIEAAENILLDHGFKKVTEKCHYFDFLKESVFYYEFLDVSILLKCKNNVLSSSTIKVESYYVGNYIY